MDRINKSIFIGTSSDAQNLDLLKENGITAILNVAFDLNRPWYNDILSLKVGLVDGPYPHNKVALDLAVKNLSILVEEDFVVLVHCHNGVNRSPFVVANYLSRIWETHWKTEFEGIRKIRPQCFVKPWMEAIK